jgi:hypothetical protein
VDATGGTFGTSILPRIAALDAAMLEATIRSGVPARGMPAFSLEPREMTALVAYLRTRRAPATGGRRDRLEPVHLQTTTGETIDGGSASLTISRCARPTAAFGSSVARATCAPATDVDGRATFGGVRGYRSTTLSEITPRNVAARTALDLHRRGHVALETTPIVGRRRVVSSGNQCYALGEIGPTDLAVQPAAHQGVGNASAASIAVATDRTHAHTTRITRIFSRSINAGGIVGKPRWRTRENYSATGAPPRRRALIAGTAGGGGARGFPRGHDPRNGTEVWRF